MSYYGFRPYLPVAKRRLLAVRELEKLKKKGHIVSPVGIEGRTIARNFWGKSWCENLERYSDYANHLPRGACLEQSGRGLPKLLASSTFEAAAGGEVMIGLGREVRK